MRCLCLFFVCVLSWPAAAQLSLGIRGGLNLSDVVINNTTDNPDAESDFRMKAGIHAGIFSSVDVGRRTRLSAELLYSNKGVRAINNRINLHYISLPILFEYVITAKWLAEVGPELSYLVVVRSEYGNVSSLWNNKIDIGMDVGIRYSITSTLSAGLRFNAGFLSVIENGGTNASGEKIRFQNRVLQLSIAYALFEVH
jgi:hypothetical protein